MLRPFRVHRLAVKHPRLADREVADVDHLLDFAVTLGLDLAHLEGHEAAKRILVIAQRITDAPHGLAAHRRRHGTPFPERVSCRVDETVVFRLRRRADAGDHFAVRGVARFNQRRRCVLAAVVAKPRARVRLTESE